MGDKDRPIPPGPQKPPKPKPLDAPGRGPDRIFVPPPPPPPPPKQDKD